MNARSLELTDEREIVEMGAMFHAYASSEHGTLAINGVLMFRLSMPPRHPG